MDDQKFIDLLKNIQGLMHCPSCGSAYEVSEMQFMGSQEGYFLLSLNCAKCSLPVWVNVFAGGQGTKSFGPNDLTVNDLRLLEKPPITADEVISFSVALPKFKGDFKALFKL